jgi:hypothetical protein
VPKVYNKRKPDYPEDAVYVGRPSIFGNPYSHLPGKGEVDVATREEAIEAHRLWLQRTPELVDRIRRVLRGKDLLCWCAPFACHADTLLRVAAGEDP